jgi:alpha-1,3-mannosyl-glycoprotein beta-1,2-N-acetylglucosaminyltransferase
MEIAPDFFDYFEAAAKLLDNDKYVTLLSFLPKEFDIYFL